MSYIFHVMYNMSTLIPTAISGAPFEDIPEGHSICKVNESDAEQFLSHKLSMNNYIVVETNGYAVFKGKDTDINQRKRKFKLDNTLMDLDYRSSFFNFIPITFTLNNNTIILNLDLTELDDSAVAYFNQYVTATINQCTIYITKLLQPESLITRFTINLYQLSKDKTITVPLIINEEISVWGCRTS